MTTEAKPSGQPPATPPAGEPKPPETPAEGQAPPAPPAGAPTPDASKGADDKPADTSTEKPTDKAAPDAGAKVPDVYTLKAPEGSEEWITKDVLEQTAAIAKAQGWTNEQAQAHLDEHVDATVARNTFLLEQTKSDPIYGGEHLEATQQLTRRIVDKVRPPGHPRREAFEKMLAVTGYGNHIEVVSFLADLGKMMREDQPPATQSGDKAVARDPATVLYGAEGKPS
jgi:hypothetical protein